MFPIAWAVIGVENNMYWSWFLSLIRDYLNLGDEGGISIISDGHKTGYPMLSTNSVPGTFMPISRRDEVGLQFKRLFWGAVATSMKLMDKGSAAFENGISKSFNSRIIGARGKPIITMLEDIRVYIMQRMFSMNKLAFDNKDSITPSVRRQMKYNKRIQRYMHMKMNPDYGVAEWYSQCKWYEAYQYSIKPVYGPKFWKPTSQPLPLPPVERKMSGRPRKRKIRHLTEDDDHVLPRVGRVMHYNKCWET
ncbi:hypothetical protein Tco_0981894 [Tanacetum coccineum]